jgi:5-methylcytosine-specific restriction endonuclease McrA
MAKRLGQHQAPSSAWITKQRRLALYIRDAFKCAYCTKDLRQEKASDLTLDHLLSKSEIAGLDEETRIAFGSPHASHNLVLACRSCNSSRQDKVWTEFADRNAQARILALRQMPLNTELAKAIIAGTAGDPRVEAARAE